MLTQVGIPLFIIAFTLIGAWILTLLTVEAGLKILLGILGGSLGLILGTLLVPLLKSAAKADLGSFDGQHFQFRNPLFMDAFTSANPDLVKNK